MNIIKYDQALTVNVNGETQSWVWHVGPQRVEFDFYNDCGYDITTLYIHGTTDKDERLVHEWDGHRHPTVLWDELTFMLLEHNIVCAAIQDYGPAITLPASLDII